MSCATRTKGYEVREGIAPCVGLTPTTAERWGGGTYPAVTKIFKTHSIVVPTEAPEFEDNIEVTGDVSKGRDYLTAKPNEGTISTLIYLESVGSFLYPALGYADLSGPHADGSLQAHIFEIDGTGFDQCAYTSAEAALATANLSLSPAYDAGDRKNREFTRLIDLGPDDRKQANCRVNSFTLSGNGKETIKCEIGFLSEEIVKDTGKTESGAWTFTSADFQNPLQFRQTSSFEVEGVEVGILDFNYTLSKEMDGERYPNGTGNNGLNRAEPFTTGPATVELTFTVEKHDALTWENYRDNDTNIAIKHEFTQGSTGFFGVYFPEVQVKNAEVDIANGSRINITAVANFREGTDSFATERTFDGGEIALLNQTPMYIIVKNSKTINYMREA